ncbi:hypothetical protein MHLP_03040 [Candidatus Mycoplasma haematolamae str. Purdue]|uniref:Uncharacterized protein n=1 Tax=Mycoplasma haematolamae (strain Purdue) TaxID=1212765 RepID=I7BJZ2_MYCHA|nr:hypothetical protein [Candidatus Mycoplasma haematolamae]AFO52188.1 hypothetical protein MHLP_03040 [Candidatus Mycoplasma haematolamae str. Purdue]
MNGFKVAGGVLGLLTLSGSGGTIAYTTLPASASALPNKATENQRQSSVTKPKTKTYTFNFGTDSYKLECPEGSHPDDSLDISEQKHRKLSIYCRWEKEFGRVMYRQEKVFNWEYLNSYTATKPRCEATDAQMTNYSCVNPGKRTVTPINKRVRGYASDNWVRIS